MLNEKVLFYQHEKMKISEAYSNTHKDNKEKLVKIFGNKKSRMKRDFTIEKRN